MLSGVGGVGEGRWWRMMARRTRRGLGWREVGEKMESRESQ